LKPKIHPKYYPEAQVICSCGNTFVTGATVPEIRTDVCSACHPFYTGEQRIVDTAGQVERFMRRLEKQVDEPKPKRRRRAAKKKQIIETISPEAEALQEAIASAKERPEEIPTTPAQKGAKA